MFTCFVTRKEKKKKKYRTFILTWKVSLVKLFCRASTWPDRRRVGVIVFGFFGFFFTCWSPIVSKVNCHRKQKASPEDHAAWRSSLEGKTLLPSFTAQPQTAPGHECISVFMGLSFLHWTHKSRPVPVHVCEWKRCSQNYALSTQ